MIDLGDEVGAGTRMKLVGNSWVLSLVEGLAETIALAEQLGVDPRDFLDMIDGGPMFAPYARLKGEAMIEREFAAELPARAGRQGRRADRRGRSRAPVA